MAAKHVAASSQLAAELKKAGLRAELNDDNETVANKIRKAIQEKIPYILVIGDREAKTDVLAVRDRGEKETRNMSRQDFIKEAREKIRQYL